MQSVPEGQGAQMKKGEIVGFIGQKIVYLGLNKL